MGFFSSMGDAVKGGISGGLQGGISGAVAGAAGSLLGNVFGGDKGPSPEELMELQYGYEQGKMALQAKYNKEQAAYSQELSKEMWDYTNYENQVKHMKEAGLNPALLYGKGGGGGASAEGAGQAAGVSQGVSQAVGMGIQAKQVEIQQDLMESQIAKNYAEAGKTAGADIENVKADTLLKNVEAGLTKAREKLANSQTTLTETEVQATVKEMELTAEKITNWITKNKVDRETAESTINKAAAEYNNTIYEGVVKMAQANLTDWQKKKLQVEIEGYWYELKTERLKAEAQGTSAEAAKESSSAAKSMAETKAKEIAEIIKKWGKELKQKDFTILQNWLLGSFNALMGMQKGAGMAIGAAM